MPRSAELPRRPRSTDESSHRRPASPAVAASSRLPSAPVLVRAETFPRVSAAASLIRSQEQKEEFERRMAVCNGLMRQPSRSETQLSSSDPKGLPPPTLSTLRVGQRAKRVEKMVHARAAMKQRLVDYHAVKQEEEIDDAGA